MASARLWLTCAIDAVPVHIGVTESVTGSVAEEFTRVHALNLIGSQVPRRIKVSAPDSQFFSVRRASAPGKEEGSKVASGMEIVYTITFKPQTTCRLILELCLFQPHAAFSGLH
eukprot:1158035-Pelagomonas_calceolata.AAC.4